MNPDDADNPSAPAEPVVHVMHVVNSLEPGGLENGVVNIVNRLDRARFKSSIVCLAAIGEFAARLRNDVEVTCLDRPDGFSLSTVRKLAQLLHEHRPDVLHTHNLGPLIYGVLGHWKSASKCGLLQGEHAELNEAELTFKRRVIRKLLYRRCDLVHTVSRALRDEMHAFGVPESKLRVTINGVDTDRYRPAIPAAKAAQRAELGIAENALVLGILGRFGAFKRHALLLDAFEQAAQSNPDLHLLMVGDHGPEKEFVLRKMESSAFGDRICWAGFQLDPVPCVQAMDLLVIPSVNEGLSNAMLESMACGVPCLTHLACGAAEVIENDRNGFLRDMNGADILAKEIATLASDPGRLHTVGQTARSDAEKRYSLDSMIDTYEALYVETAATARS